MKSGRTAAVELVGVRLRLMVLVIASAFAAMVGRLVYVQLIKGTTYAAQADANRQYVLPVPAQRGVFLDRFGNPLVFNVPQYFVSDDTRSLYSQKHPLAPDEALHMMATNSAAVSYELSRKYLTGPALAHVVGYTGQVTAEDLLRDPELQVADRIGKLGLEKVLHDRLEGQAGSQTFEINALGQRLRLISQRPPTEGQTLITTIDPYLSEVAYRAMGTKTGAVVIMDGATGEVLALVSTPSFEPNILSLSAQNPEQEQQRKRTVRQLLADPKQVFFNRAVSGAYPPGSVFKLVTALAGLDAKAITPETTVTDQGVLTVGDFKYANWFYTQYGGVEGDIQLVRALARSNDIYFYKAAEWLGPTKLAESARLLGLGSLTNVELSGEAKGLVPDPAWKERTIGERWFLGNTYHFGIGQGDLLVTPIQIAQLVQVFAAQGARCHPTLLRDKTQHCEGLSYQESDVETVLQGMLQACSPGGTAFPFFARNQQLVITGSVHDSLAKGAVACKTGTAEFGGIVDEQGHRRTHAWFVAITDPRLGGVMAPVASSSASAPSVGSGPAAPNSFGSTMDLGGDLGQLHAQWRQYVAKNGYPKQLVMVVLVESDAEKIYREGSADAAPVAKVVLDWIETGRFGGERDFLP